MSANIFYDAPNCGKVRRPKYLSDICSAHQTIKLKVILKWRERWKSANGDARESKKD